MEGLMDSLDAGDEGAAAQGWYDRAVDLVERFGRSRGFKADLMKASRKVAGQVKEAEAEGYIGKKASKELMDGLRNAKD